MAPRHASAPAMISSPEMGMDLAGDEARLAAVPAAERILLISHCLRNSQRCRARVGTAGIQCEACDDECQVNILTHRARILGYKGICTAPGGSMALKFVRDMNPGGIVAVACRKELEEGIDLVRRMMVEGGVAAPPIVVVPLTREGCVDTTVDIDGASETIALGCGDAHAAAAE